jgi:hypothetical protein
MKAIFKFASAFAAASVLSACVPAVNTYVDPQYHHAAYDTIHRLAQPISVRVDAQFEVNGTPKPTTDALLQSQVEQTLRASGVFIPAGSAGTGPEITVLANDIADIGSAHAKGFGTGMTFGAVGSEVPDNYEFNIAYRDSGTTKFQGMYQHRLITTIGNASGPGFVAPTTPADGFHHVVEDVVLNFIQDMQDKGLIAK